MDKAALERELDWLREEVLASDQVTPADRQRFEVVSWQLRLETDETRTAMTAFIARFTELANTEQGAPVEYQRILAERLTKVVELSTDKSHRDSAVMRALGLSGRESQEKRNHYLAVILHQLKAKKGSLNGAITAYLKKYGKEQPYSRENLKKIYNKHKDHLT